MTRVLLSYFLTGLVLSAQSSRVDLSATKQIQDKEQLVEWVNYYYEHPRPDLLVSAVKFMSKEGELTGGGGVMLPFIAKVFQRNPQRIAGGVSEIEQGTEDQQFFIAQALWLTPVPESLDQLRRLSGGGSVRRQKFVAELLKDPPPDGLSMEDNVDLLWTIFSISGEREPVERVIQLLPLMNVKGDTGKLLLGGSAHWSLTSNAIQHPRVMAICESYLKQASAEIRPLLDEVIGRAKRGEH